MMRLSFLVSVSAAVLLAACQKPATSSGEAAGGTADETAAGAVAASEPTTPQAALDEAGQIDQAATSDKDATSYVVSSGATPVKATAEPDNGLRVEEGDRTYFYRRGENRPFLVREGGYNYAYRDGQLTGVLDHDGKPVDEHTLQARRPMAEQAAKRGETVRQQAVDKAPPQVRQAQESRTEHHEAPTSTQDDPKRTAQGDHAGPADAAHPGAAPAHQASDNDQRTSSRQSGAPPAHTRSASGGTTTARSGPDGDKDGVSDREERRRTPGG